MLSAKEAILISLKNSNAKITKLICKLEDEILKQAQKGQRKCEGEISIQPQIGESDINIADAIEYFELHGYSVEFKRMQSPFNGCITYTVQLEWESIS